MVQSNIEHSDDVLLRAIIQGDEDAFQSLFQRYYRPLCFFVYSLLEDMPDAEDVVQELFYKLWNKRMALGDVIDIRPYLYTSARNAALGALRSGKRMSVRHAELQKLLEDEGAVDILLEAAAMKEELLKLVMEELDALPEKYRQVVKLFYIEGLSYQQVSQRLQIPEPTLRKQKERGLDLLQQALVRRRLDALFSTVGIIYLLHFVTKR